jgi:hypothetical protein
MIASGAARDGVLSCGRARVRESFALPEVISDLFMSEVKDQGNIGSCTAFAIIAALESIERGKTFSKAELYIRVKTKGESASETEGCHLSKYIPLLREGVVESRLFMSYEDYLFYVNNRRKMKKIYSKPEEDFLCFLEYRTPIVRWADYDASLRCFRLGCAVDFSTGKERPLSRHEDYVSVREGRAYYGSFHCIPIAPRDLRGFKFQLSRGSPVIIGVQTFAKFDKNTDGTRRKDDEGKDIVLDGWWWRDQVRSHRNIIDLPDEEFELQGHHAVCLCGYDNSAAEGKGAFRFKNSWGTGWADNGYAWITCRYVERYANDGLVINK